MAVHPEPHLTIDGSHVVVVPSGRAPAVPGRWKAPLAVGRDRWEWFHGRGADREHITVSCEPVGFFTMEGFHGQLDRR